MTTDIEGTPPTAANSPLAQFISQSIGGAPELPDLGFHQGLITAFDITNGQNTVLVAGEPIVNIPMLNIGDTTNLNSGDVVAVLRYKTRYFILGRIVLPNSEVFATTSVAFFSANADADTFTITTTETIKVTVTVDIPVWANKGLIQAIGIMNGRNSTAGADAVYAAVWIDSLNGDQNLQSVPTGNQVGNVTAAYSLHANMVPGGSFDITLRAKTDTGTWASSAFNAGRLSVAVTFSKE